MGVPSSFDIDVTDLPSITVSSVGPIGPVTIAGIPNPMHIAIDSPLPKIQLGLDPLEVKPLSISMALKEMPSIRGHLPADFSIGLSVLGLELMCVRLCGEAQIITELHVDRAVIEHDARAARADDASQACQRRGIGGTE